MNLTSDPNDPRLTHGPDTSPTPVDLDAMQRLADQAQDTRVHSNVRNAAAWECARQIPALIAELRTLRASIGPPRADCWLCQGLGGVAVHNRATKEFGRPSEPLFIAHRPESRTHEVQPCPVCVRASIGPDSERIRAAECWCNPQLAAGYVEYDPGCPTHFPKSSVETAGDTDALAKAKAYVRRYPRGLPETTEVRIVRDLIARIRELEAENAQLKAEKAALIQHTELLANRTAEAEPALRAAGLLPGSDDIVVNRERAERLEALAIAADELISRSRVSTGRHHTVWIPAWNKIAKLLAALLQPHPEETPKVYPSGTRRPGVYLSPDPAPQPHPKEAP